MIISTMDLIHREYLSPARLAEYIVNKDCDKFIHTQRENPVHWIYKNTLGGRNLGNEARVLYTDETSHERSLAQVLYVTQRQALSARVLQS